MSEKKYIEKAWQSYLEGVLPKVAREAVSTQEHGQ